MPSNVEDINIPRVIERLSMSCIASSGERSNIFRNRSFTLCKNDLDFNDMSDSATVLESISSSSTINLSVCSANKPGDCSLNRSYFHHFIRFPLLRRPLFVNISFWVVWWTSVQNRSHRSWLLLSARAQKYLTFISGFPRAFWCSRGKHVRSPFAASRD